MTMDQTGSGSDAGEEQHPNHEWSEEVEQHLVVFQDRQGSLRVVPLGFDCLHWH